jgi:hypothetical protein
MCMFSTINMLITHIDLLCPGMDYWVDMRWNLINTMRVEEPTHFVGKFMRLRYVSGTHTEYPESGLIVISDPSRTDVIFLDINGCERHVSSMNIFYQRYRPMQTDLIRKMEIYRLRVHFPPELLRIITSFCGGSKVAKRLRNHMYVREDSSK